MMPRRLQIVRLSIARFVFGFLTGATILVGMFTADSASLQTVLMEALFTLVFFVCELACRGALRQLCSPDPHPWKGEERV